MIQETADKLLQPLRQRYRASPLPAFLAWWVGELGALIPERFKRRLMPPKPQVWIVPAASGGGDLRIWRVDEAPRVLDVFGAGEDARLLANRWRDLMAEFDDGRPEVRLCLHEDIALALPVELPAAVQDNLAQAISYQIDQLSPFRPDQVLFDQRVVDSDGAHGRIRVDLRLVRNEDVETLLARLRGIGIVVHAVDTLAAEDPPRIEGFNLLPEERRPRHVHARARFNAMLAVVLVAALGVVMAETLILRERTAAQLRAAADQLRGEALAVASLQRQLDEALAASNFLAEKRAAEPTAIGLLDEVTRVLPDDIWLQQFQLQDGELRLQGLAEGSQRVVGLLKESPLFDSPEISGNISIDPMTGKERFRTDARVVMRAAPDLTGPATDPAAPPGADAASDGEAP